MLTSLVAVLGTLAGAVVSGLLQHRAARAGRDESRRQEVRRDQMNAATALAVALSDHRRAMWEVRDAQLTEQGEDRVRELRDESHRTRSAVTDPAVRLRLLVADDAVCDAAADAINSTYCMREARDVKELQSMRYAALKLHDEFVNTAGAYLAA